MNCDIEANWRINMYCNYKCQYCYQRKANRKKAFRGTSETKKIVDAFNNTGLKWFIYMSGGEPFFYPNFIELCQGLTEKHIISINTNLSHNAVYRFADTLNPDAVRSFHCSVHITEMRRLGLLKDFIKKYQYIKDKGFYIFASYVLYPPLLKQFNDDYELFKSNGIILRPKLFRGVWTKHLIKNPGSFFKINSIIEKVFGREYPEAYTDSEKKKILNYINRSQEEGRFYSAEKFLDEDERISDVSQDQKFLNGLPSFKGQDCDAGRKFVRMVESGDVYRCHSDKTYLGNLFDGSINLLKKPEPCRVPICQCPYFGYWYVVKKK